MSLAKTLVIEEVKQKPTPDAIEIERLTAKIKELKARVAVIEDLKRQVESLRAS